MAALGTPQTELLQAGYGARLNAQVPSHAVAPAWLEIPSNLEEYGIKLIDFGSAHLPGQKHEVHAGTSAVQAPECVRASEAGGMEADIWSLGCTVRRSLLVKCAKRVITLTYLPL